MRQDLVCWPTVVSHRVHITLQSPLCETVSSGTFSSSDKTQTGKQRKNTQPNETARKAHRGRWTAHVISPLNDIIAENLGQRGRRAGESWHAGRTPWQALSNMDAWLISATLRWKHLVQRKHSAILHHLSYIQCSVCVHKQITAPHSLCSWLTLAYLPPPKYGHFLLILSVPA